MRSLTFCAICLLAVAAGLAVYEALNAWVGVKARGLMPAWARSDQAGGSSRGRAHAGAARLWSRAVEALAGFFGLVQVAFKDACPFEVKQACGAYGQEFAGVGIA